MQNGRAVSIALHTKRGEKGVGQRTNETGRHDSGTDGAGFTALGKGTGYQTVTAFIRLVGTFQR